MILRFIPIQPHPLLKGYIAKMWLFESSGKIAADDLKLVVPNGNLKLTLSFQNGIVALADTHHFSSGEHDITLTGMMDVPVILDVQKDTFTQTLGIEFSPHAAYRFFRLQLSGLQNSIVSLQDILGIEGKELVTRIWNLASIQEKIIALQHYLIDQLTKGTRDEIFEYCVNHITASLGAIPISLLEKKTGYSSRWINMKFREKLGISAKSFGALTRFSHCYQLMADKNGHAGFYENDLDDLYYDKSHFLKDFKRFTGFAPAILEAHNNEFGRSYYQD